MWLGSSFGTCGESRWCQSLGWRIRDRAFLSEVRICGIVLGHELGRLYKICPSVPSTSRLDDMSHRPVFAHKSRMLACDQASDASNWHEQRKGPCMVSAFVLAAPIQCRPRSEEQLTLPIARLAGPSAEASTGCWAFCGRTLVGAVSLRVFKHDRWQRITSDSFKAWIRQCMLNVISLERSKENATPTCKRRSSQSTRLQIVASTNCVCH